MGMWSWIEWCDHTYNPWIGCGMVSEACKFCYARDDHPARIARAGGIELWGADAPRQFKAESGWGEPLTWDRKAAKEGRRHRVFCASQSDVFEYRADLESPRARLFDLIQRTPHLEWLLLTKRPEKIRDAIQRYLGFKHHTSDELAIQWAAGWLLGRHPENVRIGISAENQRRANERLPILAMFGGPNFISAEPLLGPIDFSPWIDVIHWMIVGGESGPKGQPIRPMNPGWARSIRDQCEAAGVPFLFKQWGAWRPDGQGTPYLVDVIGGRGSHEARRYGDAEHEVTRRLGKSKSGRTLDGKIHNSFPAEAEAVMR